MHFSNMAENHSSIQSYSLFGESQHLPDVLHCETIAARSVLHDWELAPHRHTRLHQVLLIESGGGVAHLDGEQHALAAGALINVPPGHVHAFRFTQHTQGWVATLADELMDEIFVRVGDVRRDLARPAVVTASPPITSAAATGAASISLHRGAGASAAPLATKTTASASGLSPSSTLTARCSLT